MHKNAHVYFAIEAANAQLLKLSNSIDDAYLPRDNDPARALIEEGRIKIEEGLRILLIPGGQREEGQ